MTWIAGVDGCRAGWLVVLLKNQRAGAPDPEARLCKGWKEVITLAPCPTVIAVDVPIGLLTRPRLGGRLCDQEAHPELAFRQLAGHSMQYNKKTGPGRWERLRALRRWAPDIQNHFYRSIREFRRRDVAPDDLLDAYALGWTALRIVKGIAGRIPRQPPRDRRGLRMEIWY